MCWMKKGEGFESLKGQVAGVLNLVKVAEEVLQGGDVWLQNLSDNAKILLTCAATWLLIFPNQTVYTLNKVSNCWNTKIPFTK